jgi:putative transposase
MRITYQYRLRITKKQQSTINRWIELCRLQYNYRLAERFNWWEQNRYDVNSCSTVVCHIPKLKDKPSYYSQVKDLGNTKKLFPEYKELPSHSLQNVLKRVDRAYDRWLKGNVKGNRSGKPRFKGQGRYRSITFPAPLKSSHIQGKFIQLPKLGKIKVIIDRVIPDGFQVKTTTIVKKADGYYINLSLQDSSIPELNPDLPTIENTIGIDMGLKSFFTDSEGNEVKIPQYYRKSEKKLKQLQRSLSRKKKGSNRRRKALRRVSKHHLKVSNQRKDFHYKTAHELVSKGRNIGYENLNIKGLAKTRFSKSINDAGWATFLQILSIKAANAGLITIDVNPSGTSQDCSGCGTKVPKTLSTRWHSCPSCGLELDRDHNAAINIRNRAVGYPVFKAQEMSEAIAGVTEKLDAKVSGV